MPGFMRLITAPLLFVLMSSVISAQDITPRPVKTIMEKARALQLTLQPEFCLINRSCSKRFTLQGR